MKNKRLGKLLGIVASFLLVINNILPVHAADNSITLKEKSNEISAFEEIILSSDEFNKLAVQNPEKLFIRYDNILDVQQITIDKEHFEDTIEAVAINAETVETFLDYDATLTKVTYEENGRVSIYNVLYATTVSKNKKTDKGVTLEGFLGWIDNFGILNEFVYCSGSRGGSYTGTGDYQVNKSSANLVSGKIYDDSFYSDASPEKDNTGLSFWLQIRSRNSEDSEFVILRISTSIFD